MGFPILSLIVTRIIGIPQSLLLRVLGFPNSYPGSMGFPMPFSAFLRRSFFFGFWDSPILTRGLWDSPCPLFFAFLRRSFVSRIVISIAIIAWISTGFSITATRHSVDIGCTSNSNINKLLVTRSWRRLNELSTPRNCKTFPRSSKNFQSDHQEFEGPLSSEQGQKRRKSFYTNAIQRRSSRFVVELWRGKSRLSLRGGRPSCFLCLFALAFLVKPF